MIYVASPYTHKDKEVENWHFDMVSEYIAHLMKNENAIAFSPIAFCHPIAINYNLPTDFDFWQHYCLGMLSKANEFQVLTLPGWEYSKGVKGEYDYAVQTGIPIKFVDHLPPYKPCREFQTIVAWNTFK